MDADSRQEPEVVTVTFNKVNNSLGLSIVAAKVQCIFFSQSSRFQGCKNRPTLFPGRMSYKVTKPGLTLSVVYLSMLYIVVLLFIRAPFYVLLVFVCMCSVF